MGGVHGGHSGGGFHGGSHGGHHSYHSSSYGSTYRPAVIHSVRGGHHYFNGVRYYGAYYGTLNGKPITFRSSIFSGIICLVIGIIIFFGFFTRPTTLTVTKTSTAYDSTGAYEVYDFEYYYNGVKYKGYGDDDMDKKTNSYSVLVGEEYPLYVCMTNPSSYSFENNNSIICVFSILFAGIGIGIIVNSSIKWKKHHDLLMSIGDVNGDGKIDDADLEYAEKQKEGMAEGAKQAETEKTYFEKRAELKCPFCDSILSPTDKFCQNCGAALGKKS